MKAEILKPGQVPLHTLTGKERYRAFLDSITIEVVKPIITIESRSQENQNADISTSEIIRPVSGILRRITSGETKD